MFTKGLIATGHTTRHRRALSNMTHWGFVYTRRTCPQQEVFSRTVQDLQFTGRSPPLTRRLRVCMKNFTHQHPIERPESVRENGVSVWFVALRSVFMGNTWTVLPNGEKPIEQFVADVWHAMCDLQQKPQEEHHQVPESWWEHATIYPGSERDGIRNLRKLEECVSSITDQFFFRATHCSQAHNDRHTQLRDEEPDSPKGYYAIRGIRLCHIDEDFAFLDCPLFEW